MNKLQLRVDDLQVQSFETLARSPGRGTVHGHESVDVCESGDGCVSTEYQDICDCTGGGPYNTTCDVNLTCGVVGSCEYQTCAGPQDHTTC